MEPSFSHARFVQQARWTQDLRRYIFQRTGMEGAARILEVGCGTGAILAELTMATHGSLFGLDISHDYLIMARRNIPGIPLTAGDAHVLPYPTATFDIVLCHFLLLWVADPLQVVGEIARITRPGGAVLALAEPDYGGRIDHPPELAKLGEWQREALLNQGADPLLGRKLGAIFHQAGLQSIETGILGGQWADTPQPEDLDMEWQVLEADLAGLKDSHEIGRLREIDRTAWQRGERVLFVPTFYAWGKTSTKS